MILKLIGALLMVLTGTAAGWHKAAKARNRVRVLTTLEQLMARIQGEIRYRGTALDDLLIQLKEENFCPGIGIESCSELRQYMLPNELQAGEQKQLQGFFAELGRATTEESCREGLYYQKICAELLEKAKLEAATAEQLYTKLGLCAGAMFAILLF